MLDCAILFENEMLDKKGVVLFDRDVYSVGDAIRSLTCSEQFIPSAEVGDKITCEEYDPNLDDDIREFVTDVFPDLDDDENILVVVIGGEGRIE